MNLIFLRYRYKFHTYPFPNPQVVFLITPFKASSDKKRFSFSFLKNNYLKTLLLSLFMALALVFIFYGIYGMLSDRTIGPIHPALVFLIFAILFVVGYEFCSSRLVRKSTALLVGFAASVLVTFLILALSEFVVMALAGDILSKGWEIFVIAVAFFMILSVIVLKYAENL